MGLLFVERAEEATAPPPPLRMLPPVAVRDPSAPDRRGTETTPGKAAPATTAPWGRPTPPGEDADEPKRVVEKRVWTVRGIVADVRGRIEGGYGEVWVEGEISNCRPAISGHLYLTLKDGEAQLPVVLFRRQAQLLRFRPTAGMAVLARGRLSVYEGRGELQLIAEVLEPRGAGALLVAFEQMKARLAAEGLFRAERKRSLPPFPKCVGVITSTSGAVLHDIVTVVKRRHGRLNLLVYPAAVQGPGCAASITAGLRWFNRHPERVELILVARGGGAPEDLAGFNDEALARAIAASELPVISAVGHETDFTIADFVADLRAPTPSAAAEMMTERQHRIEERVGGARPQVAAGERGTGCSRRGSGLRGCLPTMCCDGCRRGWTDGSSAWMRWSGRLLRAVERGDDDARAPAGRPSTKTGAAERGHAADLGPRTGWAGWRIGCKG